MHSYYYASIKNIVDLNSHVKNIQDYTAIIIIYMLEIGLKWIFDLKCAIVEICISMIKVLIEYLHSFFREYWFDETDLFNP